MHAREVLIRLRNAAEKLANGDDEDSRLVGAIISVVVIGGSSLEEFLGITTAPGHRKISTQIALITRDQLIREAACKLFPASSLAAQADKIHQALIRYRASAGRRARVLDSCPARHSGTVSEICWQILKLR